MRSCALPAALVVLSCTSAWAQSVERISVDAAVGVIQAFGENAGERPDVVVDVTATARIGRGWVAYIRPWFRHASAAPHDIAKEIYQAAVQRESRGRVSTRLDLGYILTPIGIGMMDMRPDSNPVTMTHLSYVVPMPSFEQGAPASLAVASSYPLGAVLTASTLRWDARMGLLASPPNRTYVLNSGSPNPKARPFAVVGGGITPRTGLRVGLAYGTGEYATSAEIADGSGGRSLHMIGLEGEFAFGYTKLTGEMTRSLLAHPSGDVTATQWFIQGAHTLSPRWYLGVRQENAVAPPSPVFGPKPTLRVSEASLGYRLSTALVVENAVVARRTYYSTATDKQYLLSLIWARRF